MRCTPTSCTLRIHHKLFLSTLSQASRSIKATNCLLLFSWYFTTICFSAKDMIHTPPPFHTSCSLLTPLMFFFITVSFSTLLDTFSCILTKIIPIKLLQPTLLFLLQSSTIMALLQSSDTSLCYHAI